jgi:twitching motility protein PilT
MEASLVDNAVLTDARLLSLKGMLSGLPVYDDATIGVDGGLPAECARAAAALLLDRSHPTVAFVEPTTDNVGLVASALGTTFDVWLLTTGQFRALYDAAYGNRPPPVNPLGDINWVLDECVRRRASDIHLKVGRPPFLRIDGRLTPLPVEPMTQEWAVRELGAMSGPDRVKTLEEEKTSDFAISHDGRRFRMNLGEDRDGWTLAGRLLANSIPSMEDLGLSDALRSFTTLERGLVLVTGPTGSGKSTLLASLLAHMSLHQGRHMITLEDPIEYHLEEGPNSVVNQRELGEHFTDFASAIRQGLRCDPDVIFVGEMRDRETAQTAVVAAETGHLVFSTLHTYDAQSTVARLVSMYPPEEQDHAREKIAYILRGVVSQTLLPRANHPGRIAAQEIMLDNPAITNNLRAPGGIMRLRDTIQTSRREGMQTMEMALAALVRQGLVTEAEALFRAKNPTEFKRYLQGE